MLKFNAACLLGSLQILCLTTVTGLLTNADYFYRSDRPLIIAHRGIWGDYPEHSLAGYIEAYYAGADFLEFDL